MPHKTVEPDKTLVKKVDGGYQVHRYVSGKLKPLTEKIYFHPTSAYAAMGRLIHEANATALELKTDPSKAQKKEGGADS